MTKTKDHAAELAARAYFLFMFRDKTTDDDYIYVARNPEINGCIAQGETMEEAQENLNEVRADLIQHLLEHNLPVPEPSWMATTTEENSSMVENLQQEYPNADPTRDVQLEDQEQLFAASLRT